MVCEFGMSNLGPLTYGKKEEQIFLGREIAQHQDYSEDTAVRIDQEVKRIVLDQYDRARQIILDNRDVLERMAQELLVRETLDAIQIRRLVAGLPLDDDIPTPKIQTGSDKPADKETVLKPILPPITGGNPATA